MRNRALMTAAASVALLAANTDAGEAAANTPAPTPEPKVETKLYLATAGLKKPAPGAKPTDGEVTFVVEAVDYKKGWEHARHVTSIGTAYFDETKVWTDKSCETPLEMRPGTYTVKSLASLQERSKKAAPVTAEALAAAFEDHGVELTDEMKAAFASIAGAPAPEAVAS